MGAYLINLPEMLTWQIKIACLWWPVRFESKRISRAAGPGPAHWDLSGPRDCCIYACNAAGFPLLHSTRAPLGGRYIRNYVSYGALWRPPAIATWPLYSKFEMNLVGDPSSKIASSGEWFGSLRVTPRTCSCFQSMPRKVCQPRGWFASHADD